MYDTTPEEFQKRIKLAQILTKQKLNEYLNEHNNVVSKESLIAIIDEIYSMIDGLGDRELEAFQQVFLENLSDDGFFGEEIDFKEDKDCIQA